MSYILALPQMANKRLTLRFNHYRGASLCFKFLSGSSIIATDLGLCEPKSASLPRQAAGSPPPAAFAGSHAVAVP